MKKLYIIVLFVLGFVVLQSQFSCGLHTGSKKATELPFKWINANPKYDTVYSADKIVTTISFLNKYSLSAEFRYDDDFSFLYPEYLKQWSLSKNGIILTIKRGEGDWASYFYTNDSVLQYQNDSSIYYLLFNKPFYCNGFACSATGILIIEQSKNTTHVYYYDSEFGNVSLLINSIKELSIKYGHLALPIRCKGNEKDSVCNYIMADSCLRR